MNNNKVKNCSFIVVILAMASVIFSVAANQVSGRLGSFGPFAAPLGVFYFPCIYVISDILSEVYGYRISRWVSWITSFVNIIFIGLVLGVISIIKPVPWCEDLNQALWLINGASFRVVVGSILGSVLAGWVNDIIFQKFKHKEGEKGFAKRKLLSSLAAEAVDTVTFITIAFLGTMPFSPLSDGGSIYTSLCSLYIVQFLLKYGVEVITEPLAHLLAKKLKKLDPDAFEDRSNFNIFGFEKKQKTN